MTIIGSMLCNKQQNKQIRDIYLKKKVINECQKIVINVKFRINLFWMLLCNNICLAKNKCLMKLYSQVGHFIMCIFDFICLIQLEDWSLVISRFCTSVNEQLFLWCYTFTCHYKCLHIDAMFVKIIYYAMIF